MLAALSAMAGLLTMPSTRLIAVAASGANLPAAVYVDAALGLLLDTALFYGLILVGISAARAVSMGRPLLHGWSGGATTSVPAMRAALLLALSAGALAGIAVLVATRLLAPFVDVMPVSDPPALAATLHAIGSAIREELVFRLGIMSAVAWAMVTAVPRAAPRRAIVAGNVAAALAFGGVHLAQPRYATLGGPTSIAFVLATAALLGVVCGWMYWRRGILAAMVANAAAGIVVQVVGPAIMTVR
jgi:hypothetical protein